MFFAPSVHLSVRAVVREQRRQAADPVQGQEAARVAGEGHDVLGGDRSAHAYIRRQVRHNLAARTCSSEGGALSQL
jgi:hypothetical protein